MVSGRASREKGCRRERVLAQIVGGRRGRAYSGEADVETDLDVMSLKSRRTWPHWLLEAVQDAQMKARRAGKAPLVVLELCAPGKPSQRLYCHVGDREWLEIHGDGRGGRG